MGIHTLYNFSEGEDSKPVVDGKEATDGKDFKYIKNPLAMADKPVLKAPPAQLHSTHQKNKRIRCNQISLTEIR